MKYKYNDTYREILPVGKKGIEYEGTYAIAPEGWSIVNSEEECIKGNILYFIVDKTKMAPVTEVSVNAVGYSSTYGSLSAGIGTNYLLVKIGEEVSEFGIQTSMMGSATEFSFKVPSDASFELGARISYGNATEGNVYLEGSISVDGKNWGTSTTVQGNEGSGTEIWFDSINADGDLLSGTLLNKAESVVVRLSASQ